ncbi:MAG: TolC family protein [Bdellovibrionota bacterium]
MLTDAYVFNRSIKQSDQIKIEQKRLEEKNNDLNDFDALYDGSLNTSLSHQIDKSDRTQTIFGTRADTTSFESTYNQNFAAGFSAEAGFRHIRQKTNNTFIDLNPAYNSAWFGSISVPILYSVQRSNQALRESFQHSIQSTNAAFLYTKQQIGFGALQTYILWIQAHKEIVLAQETLDRAQQYLSTTTQLYESGLVEQSSYFAAKANVSARHADVIATQNNYNTLHTDLTHLLRLPIDATCTYADDFQQLAEKPFKIYEQNISQRHDVKALDHQITSIQIALHSYEKEKRPSLDAFTSLALNDVNEQFAGSIGGSVSSFQPNWTIGGRLSVPFKKHPAQYKTQTR